jgi:protein-ribulosamine 3-kinase
MLPAEFINYLEELLQSYVRQRVTVSHIKSVSGGSINDSLKLECNTGNYFVKVNDAHLYPELFEQEAEGLQALKKSGLRIPEVIATGVYKDQAFILMEFIESKIHNPAFFNVLAEGVAALHQQRNVFFGWTHSNYIGSLKQQNNGTADGVSFFIEQRLQPMIERAGNLIDAALHASFEKLYIKLPEILPADKPSLLHGDLWSGNYLADENGNPVLIDPAVYYGNREMDIAMTKLFGGFDERFYQAYHNILPLENGWEERLDLWNLYPLLVHVNLFGQGYIGQVKQIVTHYV